MIKPNEHVLDHVDDYWHEVLDAEDSDAVRQHCDDCSICAAGLAEAKKRFEALKAVAVSEPSEQLMRETVEAIEMKERRQSKAWKIVRRAALTVTAASILIIGSFNVYFSTLRPTPYDLRLYGQTKLLSGTSASVRVAVFNIDTGQPSPGIPGSIELYDRANNQSVTLASFTTDQQGTASPLMEVPDWPQGSYELRLQAKTGFTGEGVQRNIELTRKWKLMLSSDKPVYKPGQTIRLRALALRRPDLHPVAGQEVEFSIKDPKGNVIFKQRDVTSKFGITSSDCPLATELLHGKYQVFCQVGDVSSERTVTVEKYVLPKFKVTVKIDKPFYGPSDQVSGTVESQYFFGQPVAGADVTIDVRAAGFSQQEVAFIEGKTDDEGKLAFRFDLPSRMFGQPRDGGNARFQLITLVKDSAGQAQTASASRVVASEPIRVEVIPEAGTLVRGVPNMVYIYASYLDGRPAQAKLKVNGLDKGQTNSLGVAAFEMPPCDAQAGLTVSATDEDGRLGRKHVTLQVGQASNDFLIRPDKSVYDGGDTVTITAVGGGVEPVFLDFIKDDQTLLTQTIDMSAGQGEIQIDLPPDVFGTVRLEAYRFGSSGLAANRSRMVFVRQANELQVKATLDSEQYRPGETAKLNFSLTDAEGNAVPGAISVAAVDEAVYSVMSQSAGMETVFFLLEKDLLQPVYTIYSQWMPQMSDDIPLADRDEFNQALFSKTAVAENMQVTDASYQSPFSLAVRSYGKKARDFKRRRRLGMEGVVVAWCSLAASLLLFGVVVFAIRKPRAFVWSAAGVGVLSASGCCLLFVLSFLFAPLGAKFETGAAVFDSAEAMPSAGMAWTSNMDAGSESEGPTDAEPGRAPPRLRQQFPETLYWQPELVTDENGQATLEIPLADSITSWRLTAGAVSADGKLGNLQQPIEVFQPFFVEFDLPVELTRGDQVSVPVVVYNYLNMPQTVELELADAEWFTLLEGEPAKRSIELKASEVRSFHFPLTVHKVGRHRLKVTAIAGDASDAIQREIDVVPDGRRVEEVASGTLDQPVEMPLTVADDAIEGSVHAVVRLYPSTFSQLVEGLDAIFQMPSGCFEQTSSTTYPNILALDYLRKTNTSLPAIEAKARQYIHVGYQRLISFEVPGGGFDWYGRPPANLTLTAYGLMEFEDMARVYDVDPNLIRRTRDWLLAQRNSDGSWPHRSDRLHDNWNGFGSEQSPNLAPTAYVAWAVFGGEQAGSNSQATLDYLLAHRPETIDDPYLLSLMINAIAAIDKNHSDLRLYADRLVALKQSSDEGRSVRWSLAEGQSTAFYGAGQSGSIEATAMATIALLNIQQHPAATRGALNWLVEQKDANGTWHSTQATVLALKALLDGTGKALGKEQSREIEIALGGEVVRTVEIPVDQSDVVQQFDLSDMVTSAGQYQLSIRDKTGTATGYQVAFRYHVPDDEKPADTSDEPLRIDISYDRERLQVDEHVTAVATVINQSDQMAPMVILDLPIPGGFTIEPGELDELKGSGKIGKYQITQRQAIIYLRGLQPGQKLELRYRLKATMPVKLTIRPGQAYEYYNPHRRAASLATKLEAVEKK